MLHEAYQLLSCKFLAPAATNAATTSPEDQDASEWERMKRERKEEEAKRHDPTVP